MDSAPLTRLPLPMAGDADVMDRRGFFEQSVRLAALALLAGTGACAVAQDLTGPTLSQDVVVNLADYPALAQAGGVARISGVSPPVALANLGGNTYTALSLICTHQGGIVQWNGRDWVCPVHGATYAEDGHWVGGQPTSSLRTYPIDIDTTAGTVTIHPR